MDDSGARFFLGEVKNIPLHRFQGLEFIFLVRGEAALEVDGTRFDMKEEDVVVCHEASLRAMQGDRANLTLRILLSSEYLQAEAGITDTRVFSCNSVAASDRNGVDFYELRRLLTRLMFAYYSDRDTARLEAKSLLLQLLIFMKTAFFDKDAEERAELPAQADERIREALAYIARNFRNPVTLNDIAEHLGFSVHYLSRLFKKQVGQGFLEYLGEVRLQNAVAELSSSKDSVLKIALSNGFSNGASFNKIFQKRFGMTPVKYRAQHRENEDASLLRVEAFNPPRGRMEHTLLKYLARFDVRHAEERGERQRCTVDMSAQPRGAFSLPAKIVKLGRMAELLKSEVREQLEDIREKLGFRVVHLRVLFGDGMHRYEPTSFYRFYEYELALSYMISLGFEPVFQIDAAAFLEEAERLGSQEPCLERVEKFLANCCERWGAEKMGGWQFEVYGREMPAETLFSLYREIRKIAISFSPQIKTGFSSVPSVKSQDLERFSALLESCRAANVPVDFVTLHAYPFRHFKLRADEAYDSFRTYHRDLVAAVRSVVDEKGFGGCGIVMMDWNTLTGPDTRADSYYRAAVILDAILSIRHDVTGMGFWLNSHIYEAMTGRVDNTILAVFLYLRMKRPVYFILTLLAMMREKIIFEDEFLTVTRDDEGCFTMLAHNPAYFDPSYAADEKYLESRRRVLDFHLEQWRGSYVFERYILDQSSGALYNKWAEMGFPSLLRPEVGEYLDMVVKPNLSMYEEQVDGTYTMFQEMQFNSILLYVIKPL